MTAPDAPQVEPLTLTLEEALRHPEINSIRYDESSQSWRWVAFYLEYGEVMHEYEGETWPEAVSAALGRPVVERRDDTAELIAALEAWRAWAAKHQADLYRGDLTVPGYDALCRLMEDSDAALARVKGGER